MTAQEPLIGSAEAARILGVDKATVTRWANKPDHPLNPVTRVTFGPSKAFLFSRRQVEYLARERLARNGAA